MNTGKITAGRPLHWVHLWMREGRDAVHIKQSRCVFLTRSGKRKYTEAEKGCKCKWWLSRGSEKLPGTPRGEGERLAAATSWTNYGPMTEEKQHQRKNSHEEEAERFRGKFTGKNPGHRHCLSNCSKPTGRTEAENIYRWGQKSAGTSCHLYSKEQHFCHQTPGLFPLSPAPSTARMCPEF